MTVIDKPSNQTAQDSVMEQFRDLFRSHPAGVTILTADPGTGPAGMTATSVVSVSVEPPALAFSLSGASSATPKIKASETVVVHMLDEHNLDLAQTFATSGIDRFADERIWSRLPTGEPYLVDALAWMRGRVAGTVEIGGSSMTVVEIVESGGGRPGAESPLVYWNRTWHRLGSASAVDGTGDDH